jgi:hypothetical protein
LVDGAVDGLVSGGDPAAIAAVASRPVSLANVTALAFLIG